MPTHEEAAGFLRDYRRLDADSRRLVQLAIAAFVADLRVGTFRPSLRVKRVQSWPGVWELSWATDGRATFSYGPEVLPGEAHIIWRRVGSHDLFQSP